MPKPALVTTEDILLLLCQSVSEVLSKATNRKVGYSAMVQKIHRTCLKPDIGCFVLFDGGFSGLVVLNFSAGAALELYQDYMRSMGMPSEELAQRHTSDEVGNVLGELMNQMVGDFTGRVSKKLLTPITQNQPKMLTINKEVMVSINTNLDRPQARRVTFSTERANIFYLELAMDKTEFIKLHDFEEEEVDPDSIISDQQSRNSKSASEQKQEVDNDLLDELGI